MIWSLSDNGRNEGGRQEQGKAGQSNFQAGGTAWKRSLCGGRERVGPIGGTGGQCGLSSEGEWEKVRSERYEI